MPSKSDRSSAATPDPSDPPGAPDPSGAGAGAEAATAPPADIATLSFEEALKALEEIVQHLETGRVDLDAAVSAYERGVWLRRHCEARLAEARAKVERIGAGPDGLPQTAPLDVG